MEDKVPHNCRLWKKKGLLESYKMQAWAPTAKMKMLTKGELKKKNSFSAIPELNKNELSKARKSRRLSDRKKSKVLSRRLRKPQSHRTDKAKRSS